MNISRGWFESQQPTAAAAIGWPTGLNVSVQVLSGTRRDERGEESADAQYLPDRCDQIQNSNRRSRSHKTSIQGNDGLYSKDFR